nr:MAG TPA: YvrJ protein family protein [Bacteriophage sp.]
MENWVQLIGSLGFPIVACICMALYVKEQTKNNREDVKELNKAHSEEMATFKDEIKEALNNNTIALTKLCEKLDERGVDIK